MQFRAPLLLSCGAITLGFLTTPVAGSIIELDAVQSGKYWVSGTVSPNHGISTLDPYYRSYLEFDLSSIDYVILGANLKIGSKSSNSSGQTVNLWDVSTPIANLGSSGASIYTDLGSGTQFGTGIHQAGTINSFTLNSAAITSLNSADALWALGIQATGTGYAFGGTWGITDGDYLKLELTLQDPQVASVPDGGSTALFLGLGLLGMVGLRAKSSQVVRP